MADWLTTAAEWQAEWRDAPTGARAERLLRVAKDDVLTWALSQGYTEPPTIPDRWVEAQIRQARALQLNSITNGDDGDAIGVGDFQTTRRHATMSAEIKRLITPLERVPKFG